MLFSIVSYSGYCQFETRSKQRNIRMSDYFEYYFVPFRVERSVSLMTYEKLTDLDDS